MPTYTKARSSASIPVAATLTTLLEFAHDTPATGDRNALLGLYTIIDIELENEGSNDALDQFEVQTKTHLDGTYVSLIAKADWGTLSDILLMASTDPSALGTASKAHLKLFIGPCYALRIQAASAGANLDTALCKALCST